jgi:hypothetical protein
LSIRRANHRGGPDEDQGAGIGSTHLFHGSDDGHGWDHHSHCSTDDLTAGAVVDDAVLGLHDGAAFFWKVDLADGSDSDDS